VKTYVQDPDGEARRGATARLAKQIHRPANFITEYKQGRTHANLDTSIALMRALGWRPEDLLSARPFDEEAIALSARITELKEAQRALVREFVDWVSRGDEVLVTRRSPGPRTQSLRPIAKRAGGKRRGA
jgi:hypothetical protein